MKLLVLRHVPHEHLGSFADILNDKGIDYDYINLYEDSQELSLLGYHGLIILGGPMGVYDSDKYSFMDKEEIIIKDAILKKIPVLGICLGAQLIAKALGAKVYPNSVKEIGWYLLEITDQAVFEPLFKGFDMNELVFQWHGDTFEIPEGAVKLFSSPLCQNQAFRFGDKVYALQFHLEVTRQMIEEWLFESTNLKELKTLKGVIDPEQILKESPPRTERLNQLAKSFFEGFCQLISNTQV